MSRPSSRGISRAAVLVTVLTAASAAFGLVRDVVVGAVFGAGPELDAYLVAQGLMNIALGLVAGAMAKAVTPTTAREAATEEGPCGGHRGFDTALTITMIVLGVASIAIGLLAAPVIAVVAPGFEADQAELATQLTRVMLVATVLVAGTNLLAAFAHAHRRFGWASLEGIPFNLVMITAAAVLGPRYGVVALAGGFVVGSAARLLVQVPPLVAVRARLRARLALTDAGFRQIVRLVPALLVGSAIGNVNTLVDRAVGSTLTEGTITALSYGWRLVAVPETVLIASLLVPLYPALGAAAGHTDELRRLVGRGLGATVTVLAPICVVLFVAAPPLVALVFGHGQFDSTAIAATATALAWYSPALIALGCREVVVRASYALGDSRAPVGVALVAMVVNVVGDLTLGPIFGLRGLAFSTTASLVLAAVANVWLLHRRHAAVPGGETLALLGRAAALVAVALAVGWGVRALTPGLPPFVAAGAVGAAVLATYVAGLWVLRAPERAVVREVLAAARLRRR